MATKDLPFEVRDITSESEVSDLDSNFDDSEGDPDYDMLEETHSSFSNLSLRNKAKSRIVKVKGRGSDNDPEVLEVTASAFDDENFVRVQKTIQAGLLGKLKVDECKLYLRKNGLRLTGNKDILIQRIKEHLEIVNGGGEKKYPPSSFVLNCKGDACTGDVVLFEQNVYEMFNIASRSASGPPCGKRIVTGRIVKESYGSTKQQHTFTIEVLWSKGEKPLPPLYPLLIKGRNLYRLKTLRQRWEDEEKRQKNLMEKHARGTVARADREARIQKKEERKKIIENRVSKKDSITNQCQSQSRIAKSQNQPQQPNKSIIPEKPEFPSQISGLYANIRGETSSIVNKSVAVTEQHGEPDNSKTTALNRRGDYRSAFDIHHMRGTDQHGKPVDSKTTARNCGSDYRSASDIHHMRGTEQNGKPVNSKTTAWNRTSDYRNASDIHHMRGTEQHGKPVYSKTTAWNRASEYRSASEIHYMRGTEHSASYNGFGFHSREKHINVEKYHPFNAETDRFAERIHYRMPLASANHFHNFTPNRESYQQKQLCKHYLRGRCYFGDNCKFLHDLRE